MLKIGVFSKFAQVSISVLHYYDEIGLFRPNFVDEETGYRYYTADQISELNRILALKRLGLTITEIQRLIHDDISTDEIKGMLKLRKSQIRQTIAQEYARLNDIELCLEQIDLNGTMKDSHVTVKTVPTLSYLSIRCSIPMAQVKFVFEEIYNDLQLRNIKYPGPGFGVVYGVDFAIAESPSVDMEIGYVAYCRFPKRIRLANDGIASLRKLPPVPKVVSMIHAGARSAINHTYSHIRKWMEINNYRAEMPVREVYLRAGNDMNDPTSITEVQVPITQMM